MTDIVLAVPCGAASFQRGKEQASPEVAARVREWPAVTVIVGSVAYVPLRSDWMPGKERKTSDGVEVLLAGRWPGEVQQALSAGKAARIGASLMGDLWDVMRSAAPKDIATCGLSGLNDEEIENGGQNEAPPVAEERVEEEVRSGIRPVASSPPLQSTEHQEIQGGDEADGGKATLLTSSRLRAVDGWKWSYVISEIRARSKHYPEPIPDDNTLTEAEAKALLKVILQHPDVIAAEERHEAEGAARRAEYRDARTMQYAIPVGVALPDPTPPMATQEFSCTDDGNGDRLVAQYKDSVRYCKTFDAWFLWDGIRWGRDETCRMLALAKRVARTIHIEASTVSDDRREKVGKWALASGMLARLKAMTTCACPAVAVTPEEFDAHPTLLNCQNGTLELDTLTFRAAKREDLLTKCCGVDYDPSATCPAWLAHLDLVFGGDAAYVEGFQGLCGYALLQENPEQIMAILFGAGKNGKSVTIGALARVWGDYAVNIAAESLMVKRSEGPRSDLARLHGARLVTASEGEAGTYLAESVVKQITGDDAITVRRLYENEFQFRPGAKVFLATNHEPRIRGTDEGIWRRLWLLPFMVTIPEEARDPAILTRLEAEGSGILNWCIEGLRRYHVNGCRLSPPAKVLAATARFRSESDMVGRFLAHEMKPDPLGTIERAVLFKIYLKWCEEEGERPVSNRAVTKYLRERQYGERKLGGAMCWTGIKIKSAMEAAEDEAAGSVQGGL
ncbi:MAG: phage/plasmid primase, P4 family [Bacilli bacterium]|jgi:putative DNA primase/helicase